MARASADLGFFLAHDEGSTADSAGLMEIFGGMDASPGILEAERKYRLQDQLQQIEDAQPQDYDEVPATDAAIAAAHKIVGSLPAWVAEPEIEIDGRGGVSFEWYRSPTTVTVITTDGPILHWAALSGNTMARSSGSTFSSGGLPDEPLRILRRQRNFNP